MDFELETFRRPSRRSRPLAWLAAISGVALVTLALASTPATLKPGSKSFAASIESSHTRPDATTTSSIAASTTPLHVSASMIDRNHRTPLPQSERHLLILLIFACFTVMAIGGFALWKRGWQDLVQRARGRQDV